MIRMTPFGKPGAACDAILNPKRITRGFPWSIRISCRSLHLAVITASYPERVGCGGNDELTWQGDHP